MSIQLIGPRGFIILPNPELGDSRDRVVEIQLHRAMDNTTHTHVKNNDYYRYNYTFIFTHIKALEFLEFLKNNIGSIWHIEDYDFYGFVNDVYLMTSELELNNFRRSVYTGHSQEAVTLDLSFEGAP